MLCWLLWLHRNGLLFEKYIFFFLCKLYIQSSTGSIFSLFFINWIHKGLVMVASQPLLLVAN